MLHECMDPWRGDSRPLCPSSPPFSHALSSPVPCLQTAVHRTFPVSPCILVVSTCTLLSSLCPLSLFPLSCIPPACMLCIGGGAPRHSRIDTRPKGRSPPQAPFNGTRLSLCLSKSVSLSLQSKRLRLHAHEPSCVAALCLPYKVHPAGQAEGILSPLSPLERAREKLHVLKNNVYDESDGNATGLQKAGRVMVL